jgi:predicted component of type VI protein secretion system
MPKLIVTLPDGSNVTLGRISDNVIQIEDASVSSHHAEIIATGKQYILKDLDSTNGTRVNDQPFTQGTLRDGDHIRFGKIESRYASDNPEDAQPLPEAEEVTAAVGASSHRPDDFSNASPFKTKSKKKDPIATAILAFAGVSVLVFIGAVVCILQLQAPQ